MTDVAGLSTRLQELLFRHDPIGIAFEEYANFDEYEPEVRTILLRLPEARSMEEVLAVVHEEFVHWFGTGTAGPPTDYAEIASEIWTLWRAERAE